MTVGMVILAEACTGMRVQAMAVGGTEMDTVILGKEEPVEAVETVVTAAIMGTTATTKKKKRQRMGTADIFKP